MFSHPTPVGPAPASPLDPAQQNDFRETTISAKAEQDTWRERRSAISPATKLDPMREANPDEWQPITFAAGLLTTSPVRIVGDDAERRSCVLLNVGTDPLLLAPSQESLNGVGVVPTCFYLPAGASITVTTTRQIWAVATTGTNAGISAFIERGARTR